jgi:GTP-binding protein Era
MQDTELPQRCGLIAIVGRPNVGKSTLLNALVGQKVSITSKKAQTTRHRITGVRTVGEAQFVFVDTPGFQTRHGNALNRALNRTVTGALADVDLVLFVVEAGKFGLDDAKVLSLMPRDKPVVLVANKLDAVHRRADLLPWLKGMQERHPFAEFVPLSAMKAADVERLFAILAPHLPEQSWFFEEDALTDRSERFLASELIREKLFRLTGDELPYSCTVVIDRWEEEGPQSSASPSPPPEGASAARGGPARREGPQSSASPSPPPEGASAAWGGPARPEGPQSAASPASAGRAPAAGGGLAVPKPALRRIAATIVVERDAHKGMVIGQGGERLKRIGSEARQELERLTEARVFLELFVKVRSGWADSEEHLRSYGYE